MGFCGCGCDDDDGGDDYCRNGLMVGNSHTTDNNSANVTLLTSAVGLSSRGPPGATV